MRRFYRAGMFAGVSLLSGVFFACGGDSLEKVDAEDWVEDVCDEAADFDVDLSDAAGDFFEVVDEGDPDEIKDAAGEFEDATEETIDAFVKAIEEVGEPDIEGGSDVIKAIRAHANERKEAFADFRGDIDDIDEDDDEDFRDAVFDLLDDFEDTDLRDRLEDIDENDVDDLIDEIDATDDCGLVMFSS